MLIKEDLKIFVNSVFRKSIKPNGEGAEDDPCQITSLANLLWISGEADKENTCKKFYKLMNDIDASETQGWNDGAGFSPIGQDKLHAFQGTFDGNNKKITDLYINRTGSSGDLFVGLFGYVQYATIKNLELKNVNISGGSTNKSTNTFVGGLVGENDSSGTITNCTISGNVTGANKGSRGAHTFACVGGLVGSHTGRTISGCTSSCKVTSNSNDGYVYAGGLIGHNYNTIKNCTTSGNVTGRSSSFAFISGLVGKNYGKITSCTVLDTISKAQEEHKENEDILMKQEYIKYG